MMDPPPLLYKFTKTLKVVPLFKKSALNYDEPSVTGYKTLRKGGVICHSPFQRESRLAHNFADISTETCVLSLS